VAIERAGERRCPETGLAVPECSCKRCLETMLRALSPDLIAGEIKVTRNLPRAEPGKRRREAA